MGTVADKLTYLNTTKGKIKDSINLTGANIGNSDTFRSYSAKLRDGLVGVLNDGGKTLYNNFPKVTATGSSATLNSTYQAPMRVGLKGNTYQDGVPTPTSPIPVNVVSGDNEINVVGKNLLYLPNGTKTSNGVTSTITNGKLKIVGTTTTSWFSICDLNVPLESGTYTFSYTNKNVARYNLSLRYEDNTTGTIYGSTNSPKTFTLSQKATIYGLSTDNNTTGTSFDYEDYLMIEKGSTATDYVAHKEQTFPLTLPNGMELAGIGDYQDEIRKSTGKNLFDKDNTNILNAYINATNSTIVSHSNSRTLYIPIKPSTTYTISKILSKRFIVVSTIDIPANNIVGTNIVNDNSATNLTITTGVNDKYLAVFYYLSGTDTLTEQQVLDSIMIEEGSQATDYEPYGVGVWYKYGNVQKFVLDGTEDWVYKSDNAYFYTRNYKEAKYFKAGNNAYSTRYLFDSRNSGMSNLVDGTFALQNYNNLLNVFIKDTRYNTAEAFAEYLQNNNIPYYYPLATPTYEPITDTTLIEQLNALEKAKSYTGVTNITAEYVSGNQPLIMDVSALLKEE